MHRAIRPVPELAQGKALGACGKRGLDGELSIWSKNCCNPCKDVNLLQFSTSVQTSSMSLDKQCSPLQLETHVTKPG